MKQICINCVGNTPEEKLQSLIEIETILVMALGDEAIPKEEWNNMFCYYESEHRITWYYSTIIVCGNIISYHNHEGGCGIKFRADDLKSILEYLLD